MPRQGTSIHSLLEELQSFITIDPKDLERAKKVRLSSEKNAEYKELLQCWKMGDYDEAPELLAQRLIALL